MRFLDTGDIVCGPVGSEAELEAVLEFHANVYIEAGIVDSADHELLHDSCIEESVYFAAYRHGEIVGCARLIPHSSRIPIYELLEISAPWKERLDDLPLDRVAYEISALSVSRGAPGVAHTVTTALYREMVAYSVGQGRTIWLAIITPMLRRILEGSFRVPLEIIGPSRHLVGADRMPCVIDLVKLLEAYREQSPVLWDALVSAVEIDLSQLESDLDETGPRI
jgi:N-acyl-L-homoserine lactone synthetase